ncbi:hypothetical protein BCR43DRAFT_498191 [Syncephalastrum racemosum]|uniref:Uncharacterized protein n=1 Tax=Syncephalastrum racemosum TaxID=13706 RepID=A0A1X2H4N0_SYNRA|nr:hypothetical protein BCR43DRAFT_498191 [Syncephalastrum racemosum]
MEKSEQGDIYSAGGHGPVCGNVFCPDCCSKGEYRYENALSTLERKTHTITPPLEELGQFDSDTSEQPYPYIYLLNLFTAPNMSSYLANAHFTEDVYGLPIHLQSLISEAKEEVVFARTRHKQGLPVDQHQPATRRLERLKEYVWARSGHDMSMMTTTIDELVDNDDELTYALGI